MVVLFALLSFTVMVGYTINHVSPHLHIGLFSTHLLSALNSYAEFI